MRKAKAKTVPSDKHAKAIYAIESAFCDFNRQTLTPAQARRWVARACWAFRLKPPTVKVRRNNLGWSYSLGSLIVFKRKHLNPAIALHEAAHYITDKIYVRTGQVHGPSWLGVYCTLLNLTLVCPAPAMKAMLRTQKLKARRVCRDLLRKSLTDISVLRP